MDARALPEQSPLSASGLVETRGTYLDPAEEDDGLTPQPWDDEPWWHLRWLPWAEGATGSVQAVDLRAGGPGQGRLGRAGHSGGADLTDSS